MISIIVPVYNASSTIEKCLNSVVEQTVEEKEIIFVNDGSTDESLSFLLEQQKKLPEIVVLDKENGGVSSARNAGLKIAKGEYVTFLDSDDYYMSPNYLENMLNSMGEDRDLAIAGYTIIKRDGQTPINVLSHVETVQELAENYLSYTSPNIVATPWNKLFKRELIFEKFDETMTMGEDAYFVINYIKKCKKISFCNDCSYGYVFLNTSTTSEFRAKQLYDIRQTNLYHLALLGLWQTVLGEARARNLFVRLRTNAIKMICFKLIRGKGFWGFLRHDLSDVLSCEFFSKNKEAIISHSWNKQEKCIINCILQKKSKKLKISMCKLFMFERLVF